MIDFSEAVLSRLAIHKVGNKVNEDGLVLSASEVVLKTDVSDILTTYFTRPFKQAEVFHFAHDAGLQFNEVYSFVKDIFTTPEKLHPCSKLIAGHLYEQ